MWFFRYLEEQTKKFVEQQAKHRDAAGSVAQMGAIPPQQMPYPGFAPAPGSTTMMPSLHMNGPGRPPNVSFLRLCNGVIFFLVTLLWSFYVMTILSLFFFFLNTLLNPFLSEVS